MSKSRTSSAAALFLPVLGSLVCGILVWGCSLISFDRLTVTVWPRDRNAVLTPGESSWVEFPGVPDRPSAQRLFTLSSPDGAVPGDFRWEGRRMYFDAAPALRPGVRYVLAFRGRVTLENGEAFDADEEVPFYVGHVGPGPALVSANPADGGICGVSQPLILSFSAPLDPNSFVREFDLQPSSETVVTWDTSGRVATIAPRDAWSNLATYTWKAGKDMSAPDGTPIGIDYSGLFRVQEDSTAPTVASVAPALRSILAPTGLPLDQTGADDALLITFSEDVRADSVASAFTLTPSTRGTLLKTAPGVFAFTPESPLVMDQLYTVRIGPTVEDLAGNKLASAFETSFTPAIPVQRVLCVKPVYPSPGDEWNVFNTAEAKPVTIDVDGKLTLVIQFKEPFSVESGVHLLSGIVFEGYFPAAVADPSLVSASWSGGLALTLSYTGLEKSAAGVGKYYKLTLPGGAAASDNGAGSFLKEDVWLYFLTNQ